MSITVLSHRFKNKQKNQTKKCTWPEKWDFDAVINISANVYNLRLIPPCPSKIFKVLRWILHLERSNFMCVSTARARAGCAVFMALCLKTGKIVAIVWPGCKHNPGQRLCYLVISSTVVYLWVDERLGMLPPLKWFVRSWWEPIAGSSGPWRIAILHTSNHSSHPGGLGNFDSLLQNH